MLKDLKNKLLSDGFLHFNLKDIDVELFNELRNVIPTNSQDLILRPILNQYYICKDLNILTHHFINQFDLKYPNLLKSYQKNHALELASQPIGSRRFLELKIDGNYNNLVNVKDYLSNLDGVKSQSWFQGQIDLNYPNILNPIYKIYKLIISNFYALPEQYYDNLKRSGVGLTCFETNDFIINHRDGQNDGRYGALLLYLNDDWGQDDGGDIILENTTKVSPQFGNVVLFDFTKNNSLHEVIEPIKNKSRFASLTFIEY